MSDQGERSVRKHNHYFKSVEGLADVDVYRVLLLFGVTDPCIQHAIKKLLVAGGRGAGKDINRDVQEAVDTLQRWQEMRREEKREPVSVTLPTRTVIGIACGEAMTDEALQQAIYVEVPKC